MNFPDDALLPENQQPLVIQVAPYGPEFLPEDSTDIPVTMDEQIQKAVDCWNAGATVLHVHCREADGKGSKRLSMFNELLARLRDAVPQMVLQVGGSISFAPEGAGELVAYARCFGPGVKYREASIGRVVTARGARGGGLGEPDLPRGHGRLLHLRFSRRPAHTVHLHA